MARELIENCFELSPTIVNRNYKRFRKIDAPIDERRPDINYYWNEEDGDGTSLFVTVGTSDEQKISLEEVELPFTRREYFLCPKCQKRVYKIFLLPNGHEFSCRRCHSLRYTLTTINRKTPHGKVLYQLNRLDKLSRQRMNIRTPIYRGQYTQKFQRFLRMCDRAGLHSVVEDARGLMEALKNTETSPTIS